MEPWEEKEFLERRLDPLRPGFWMNINRHRLINQFYLSPEVPSLDSWNKHRLEYFPDRDIDI